MSKNWAKCGMMCARATHAHPQAVFERPYRRRVRDHRSTGATAEARRPAHRVRATRDPQWDSIRSPLRVRVASASTRPAFVADHLSLLPRVETERHLEASP